LQRLYFLKILAESSKTFKEIFCPDFRDPTVLKGFLGKQKSRDSIEGNFESLGPFGHFSGILYAFAGYITRPRRVAT
jgi:hypothetical protein